MGEWEGQPGESSKVVRGLGVAKGTTCYDSPGPKTVLAQKPINRVKEGRFFYQGDNYLSLGERGKAVKR